MLKDKADMIIGSRYINKIEFQSTYMRRIGGKILSKIINIISGKKIADPTSGFRMANNLVIKTFCQYYPQDYPEPESIVSILRLGFKVEEMAVEMKERQEGKSSINVLKS